MNPFAPENRVFRKAALERLETPEPLDRPVTFARPKGWVALIAAAWLAACLLAWLVWPR